MKKQHHMFKDETGKVYGRLKVKELAPRSEWKSGSASWICECSCGHTTFVLGGNLRAGFTQSCGCYGKEARAKGYRANGKKYSKYARPENSADILEEFDELNIL